MKNDIRVELSNVTTSTKELSSAAASKPFGTDVNKNDRRQAREKPWKSHNSKPNSSLPAQVSAEEAKQLQEPIPKSSDDHHRGGLAFDISFSVESQQLSRSTLRKPHTDRLHTETKKDDSKADLPKNWADKQSECFTGWLDYTFNPEEENMLDANSSSAAGLRTLLIHRRLAQVRSKASELFYGDSMRTVRAILLKEIGGGKLSMRPDRDVAADVQLRKQLSNLLLSYTTPWLRMGLEVMFGESIEPWPVVENGPRVRTPLAGLWFPLLPCDSNAKIISIFLKKIVFRHIWDE
jgi:hypothetical protein